MKIIRLKAENVKRLSAVEIVPGDASTITLGGKNEAGKSSVLDAIAMALGGAKLAPAEPIRQGHDRATIEVDLGDYLVTRTFKRVYKEVGSDQPDQPTNEYISTLTIVSKPQDDKPVARFASPQSMLDKIVGSLSFDPLTFATTNGADQAAILRRVVKLDTTRIDQLIKDAEAERVEATRDYKQATARLVKKVEGAPDHRISAEDVGRELKEARRLEQEAQSWASTARSAETSEVRMGQAIAADQRALDALQQGLRDLEQKVELQRYAIEKKQESIKIDQENLEEQRLNVKNAQTLYEQAKAKVPQIESITARVKEVADLNAKFDHNALVDTLEAEAKRAHEVWMTVQAKLAELRDDRQTLVENAKFPVEGLAFSGNDGVSYRGVPFAQASTAVKLRVSVAVGLALNPTLKVLLIREGAFLDDDNLALVGRLAEEAGAQVWVERVGTDGVSVVIEDGHVR